LWELGTLPDRSDPLDLNFPTGEVDLPALSAAEALLTEQSVLGLSAGEHVMTHLRQQLSQRGICSSGDLTAYRRHGDHVRIAGLLVVHQAPPTAKGHHFLTLEDEEGLIDIIVRPRVYERFQRVLHTARLLLVEGTVQKDGSTNILAQRIEPFLFSVT
jgi:error-prone DNA polymerase